MAPAGLPPVSAAVARNKWALSANHFFMTIATTLGTGILALPVKLASSGLGPLALTLTVVCAAQLAAALMMVELIQRASVDVAASDGGLAADTPITLHLLSRLYLRRRDGSLFTLTVTLHLASILVSYLLAGSLSLGSLIGLDPSSHTLLLAPYAFILTAALLRFSSGLARLVSALTAAKMTLILVMMLVTASLVGKTGVDPVSTWSIPSILHPFLIGTVALGGVVNLMPLMAAQIPRPAAWPARTGPGRTHAHEPAALVAAKQAYASSMHNFAIAVCSGLLVCWALNLAWAGLVLAIVPQTEEVALAAGLPAGLSLEYAARHGQISTVSLVAIIRMRHPGFAWVATSVSVFMAVSISVSYVVMGSGLKHLVDGVAAHWAAGGMGSANKGLHGLRDPSPLLLRPAVGLHRTVSSAIRGARPELSAAAGGHTVALSVKSHVPGVSSGSIPPSSTGQSLGPNEDSTSLLSQFDSMALPGASTLAADVAAAGVLARLADEEARLSLFLDGDGLDGEGGRNGADGPDGDDDEEEVDLTGDDGPVPAAGARKARKQRRGPRDGGHDDGVDTTAGMAGAGSGQAGGLGQGMSCGARFARGLRTGLDRWAAVTHQAGKLLLLPLLPFMLAYRGLRSCSARRAPWLFRENGLRGVLYVLSFGVCYSVAQARPSAFLSSLEVFTSLALNISCGYYVASMYVNGRRVAAGQPLLPPLIEGAGAEDEEAWFQDEAERIAAQAGSAGQALLGPASAPGAAVPQALDTTDVLPVEVDISIDGAGQGGTNSAASGASGLQFRSPAAKAGGTGLSGPAASDSAAGAGTAASSSTVVVVDGDGQAGASGAASPGPAGLMVPGVVWTLPARASVSLPQLAWLTFGCAVAYDCVETSARVAGWEAAAVFTILLCLTLSHGWMAARVTLSLRGCGVLKCSGPPKAFTRSYGAKGRASVGLMSVAALCGGAAYTHGLHLSPATSDILYSRSTVASALLLACALLTLVQRGTWSRPGLGLLCAGLVASLVAFAAVVLSIPVPGVAVGTEADAWRGTAAAAAWLVLIPHAVDCGRVLLLLLLGGPGEDSTAI